MSILLVSLGGGLGAVARYLLGVWVKMYSKERVIPTAMLTVNLIGAFGLGLFFNYIYEEIPKGAYEERAYLFFGIGFFGAFTTFSTFSVEAITLLQKKKWIPLLIYITFSIGGSIVLFGFALLVL